MQEDTVAMPIDNHHLASERIALFDEHAPTADELAHLAQCVACKRERDVYASLFALAQQAAAEPPSSPRLIEWDALAVGLRREGLLAPAPAAAVTTAQPATGADTPVQLLPATAPVVRATGLFASPHWMRAAAAMVLVLGGAALGRISAGSPQLASLTTASATTTPVAGDADLVSVEQATDLLYSAQRDYERASLYLAGNDSTTRNSDVYRARLAALDQMMTASRAALRDAPQDPVLNHYFLTAYTAREATLKQLSAALPVDKSLERY
jgi:hypothetical protein